MERPSVLEDADVLVHSSTREDPENELTINARDPALGVYWPRLDDVREAITSDEDGAAPPLLQAHDRFVDTVPGVISSHWSPYELVRDLGAFYTNVFSPIARFQHLIAPPFN